MTAYVEKEQRQLTPEEMAMQEVDGYIERVEKQVEIPQDVAHVIQPVSPPSTPSPITDPSGQVVMEPAKLEQPEIDLPLTEAEVREGLHHKVIDSFRWL